MIALGRTKIRPRLLLPALCLGFFLGGLALGAALGSGRFAPAPAQASPSPAPSLDPAQTGLPPGGQLLWSGQVDGVPARVITTLSNGYACLISQVQTAGKWVDKAPGQCLPAGSPPVSGAGS